VRWIWQARRPAWAAGFALVAAGALAFNTWFVFLPNHLVATTSRSLASALAASVGGLVVTAVASVAFGRLSDRRGRRPVILGCLGALAVIVVPLWLLGTSGSLAGLVAAQAAAGVTIAGVLSVAAVAEMFPTRVRATGLALTAGLATATFGGTAPLVDQILFKVTGHAIAAPVYIAAVAVLALLALRGQPETVAADLA
jgi:MHS family proline/betaine transporter-like MFS transporter